VTEEKQLFLSLSFCGLNFAHQLWCDGDVAAMSPWTLLNRNNSAAHWNSDHELHPEGWSPSRWPFPLIGLQVLLFPLHAGRSGLGKEANSAFMVLHPLM
jgi:hypothetical protein